jgi:hypothetical protein
MNRPPPTVKSICQCAHAPARRKFEPESEKGSAVLDRRRQISDFKYYFSSHSPNLKDKCDHLFGGEPKF